MAWKTAVATALFAQLVCPRARAGDDPRTSIAQLEQDVSHQAIVADALARAKDALERATRLHALHDDRHAAEADGLALEWAAVGRDLARAVDAEGVAADVRRRATDTQAQLERSRALVEESIARVGRLETEVSQAQRPDGASRVAVESHADQPAPGPARQPPSAQRAPAPKAQNSAGSDVKP
jgi:hypothetical protein